ncbi:DUF4232 domain-containing protein [Streptomyces sp. NPDC007083]|uniref:DUF4232 domain-containing protein n=1 Tax=unclassified Streptomyces TaxID=2593676 RepID=UPI003409D471
MTEQHRSSTARSRAGKRFGAASLAVAAAAGLGLAGAGAAQALGNQALGSQALGGQALGGQGASSVPTCSTSGLTASFGKKLGGGMNHEGVVLELKNTSGHTCNLRGYPGLGLEDSGHRTLSSTVHWGDTWYAKDPGKKTITLKDDASVAAVISWTHANTGTSDARDAAYLQVTPPANTTHKTLKFPSWVDNGRLEVTALATDVHVG